jgi:hypothetical protein
MSATQLKLFTPTAKDRSRFGNQRDFILSMLEKGPVLRSELVNVARNVTARISELRASGYDIECQRYNDTGETVYCLLGANG